MPETNDVKTEALFGAPRRRSTMNVSDWASTVPTFFLCAFNLRSGLEKTKGQDANGPMLRRFLSNPEEHARC